MSQPEYINPWIEGSFTITGDALLLQDGKYSAHYSISTTAPESREVVLKRRFGMDSYPTRELAIVMAISAGQHFIRSLPDDNA